MSITETIDAMRAARGSEELTAKQWLDALGIAGGAIKFGRLLSEHIDTRAGVLLEYRLFGRYDSHVKRWTFRVWTDEDVAAAGRAAAMPAIIAQREWAAKEQARRDAQLARDSERRERPRAAVSFVKKNGEPVFIPERKPLMQTVAVQAPMLKPEILETTRVIDGGKIVRTAVLDAQGNPVLKNPAPAARVREAAVSYVLPAAAPPATPSESFGSTPAVLTPIWVRERRAPTKAELAAQHQQMSTGSTFGGFADPCGIVSAAIARERSSGRTVHVTGPWPGSKF